MSAPGIDIHQSSTPQRWIVTKGIFADHKFRGHVVTISTAQRVWDDDSVGRSYPLENCKLVTER